MSATRGARRAFAISMGPERYFLLIRGVWRDFTLLPESNRGCVTKASVTPRLQMNLTGQQPPPCVSDSVCLVSVDVLLLLPGMYVQ